jgi:hypothetical protein
MSQNIFSSINPSTTSGSQLATLLNNFKDAVVSGMSGTSRPSELTAGGFWVDTSLVGYLLLKIYDGVSDITMVTVNLSSGTASLGGSDSIFEIQKSSDDDISPILSLFKKRIAGTGQVTNGDGLGKIEFDGFNDASTQINVANLEVEMIEPLTNSAKGSALRYSSAASGSGAVVETVTIKNLNLGLTENNPEEKLHLNGKILVETQSADDVAATIKLRKGRAEGAVLSGDGLGSLQSTAYDTTAAGFVVSEIKTSATENHSPTNKGSKIVISTTDVGAATPSEVLVLKDFAQFKKVLALAEMQIGPGDANVDGNFRFVIVGGKLQLQSRTSGVWNMCQEWEQL